MLIGCVGKALRLPGAQTKWSPRLLNYSLRLPASVTTDRICLGVECFSPLDLNSALSGFT